MFRRDGVDGVVGEVCLFVERLDRRGRGRTEVRVHISVVFIVNGCIENSPMSALECGNVDTVGGKHSSLLRTQ